MSGEAQTLDDLFGPQIEQLSKPEGASTRARLQAAIAARFPAEASKVVDAVLAKMRDLLKVDLSTIVGLAFSQSELLANYLDAETLRPAESMEVAVAEHAIESSHSPSMAIEINGVPVGTLGVDIDLALSFEGMVLNIEHWKLNELNPGACAATGTLGVLGITLAEKEAEPVQLPKKLRVGNGLQIGRFRIGKAEDESHEA